MASPAKFTKRLTSTSLLRESKTREVETCLPLQEAKFQLYIPVSYNEEDSLRDIQTNGIQDDSFKRPNSRDFVIQAQSPELGADSNGGQVERDFCSCFEDGFLFADFIDENEAKIVEENNHLYKSRPSSKIHVTVMDFEPRRAKHTFLSDVNTKNENNKWGRGGYLAPTMCKTSKNTMLCVYKLQLYIAAAEPFLNNVLYLRVTVQPPPKKDTEFDEFQKILQPHYREPQMPFRSVHVPVKIVQPLSVQCKIMDGPLQTIYARVTNQQETTNIPLLIHDIQLHLVDSKGEKTPGTQNLYQYLKVSASKDDLPVSLNVNDEYAFVIKLEPILQSINSEPPPPFSSQVVLTWSIPCIQGKIMSSYDVQLNQLQHPQIIISLDVTSPVPVNTMVEIPVTITNVGEYTRNLSLNMGYYSNSDGQNNASNGEGNAQGTSSSSKEAELNKSMIANEPPILCLEKSLHLGKLKPKKSISCNLRFITLRAGLVTLDKILVVDSITKKVFTIQHRCQMYIRDA